MSPSPKSFLLGEGRSLPIPISFPLCLAPMVGMSHVVLRRIVRSYLPSSAKTIWPTEMLSSWKIPKENVGYTPETLRDSNEDGLIPQILGNEEKPISETVQKLTAWGAMGIDINMGCPVQKALKHNYGVALMGDPEYAARVVQMTRKSTELPISVKLRAGHQNDFHFLKDFVSGLVESGADWICLHPRTAAQKRRGTADWPQIYRLKSEISVPVIGNGDIQTAEDVDAMLLETGCDLVMSGRALAARPWMVLQVAENWGFSSEERRAPRTPEEEGAEYGKVLERFLVDSVEAFGENLGLRKFRFHVKMTSVWLDYGHSLLSLCSQHKNSSELLLDIQEFFSRPQPMAPRTQLRE